MDQVFYFPCDSKGKLLKGFCPTKGSMNGYLKDIRIWRKFGVKYVVLNGVLHTV